MADQITLHIKVNKKDVNNFKKIAGKYKRKHQDVLRELIAAYADQRVTITQTESQLKQQEEVYES